MITLHNKKMICLQHPNTKKEFAMLESQIYRRSKKAKQILPKPLYVLEAEYLYCPRCFQVVEITPDIRLVLDEHQHGNPVELSKFSTRELKTERALSTTSNATV